MGGGTGVSGRHVQRTLQPAVLRWARERAGFGTETIAAKVGVRPDRVLDWERSGRISMSQADRLAHHTHTPVGYLYLVNGADFKAAQMFTLAHELAHVFVGATDVSNVDATPSSGHDAERFCNSAAAEFLVSEEELIAHWRRVGTVEDSLQAVARRFKVSVLVAAHRALRLRLIERDDFAQFYDAYQQQAARRPDETTGGNFWNSQNVRIGRRFGAAVRRAVKEGRLSYREAYALTGLRGDTFDTFVRSLDPTT